MKKNKRRPVWAWDIEAVNWDQPVAVCALSEDGDEIRHHGPDCLEKMTRDMKRLKGSWVAHAGGIYDTLLAMRHIPARSLIQTGSSILCANYGHLKLRDSFSWWLAGLAKVGRAVGTEKMDVDRQKIQDLTKKEVLDYCAHDCLILMRGIKECQNYLNERGADRRWTAGGSAMALLKALEPSSALLMRQTRPDVDLAQNVLTKIRGGRVECWHRGHVDRVYSYDFKSSYPARYYDNFVGLGLRAVATREKYGLYFCRWFWPWPEKIPPSLDTTTQAGAGWCDGYLVDCEIEAFEELGVQIEIFDGFAPVVMAPIGHVFARDLFASKEGGGTASFFSKVFLNSLHGKFQENPYKVQWTRDRPKKWIGAEPERLGDYWRSYCVTVDDENRAAWNCHPIAAAQVLGRARVALWRVFKEVQDKGGRVYYADTDSVHTDLTPDQMRPLGGKIGDLALETGPTSAIYLGPKNYLLHEGGRPIKAALKGNPFNALKNATRSGRSYVIGDEKGFDYRFEIFDRALKAPVTIERDTLSSFISGIDNGWAVTRLRRTLSPTGRGKFIGGDGWHYVTPAQLGYDKEAAAPYDPNDDQWWDF